MWPSRPGHSSDRREPGRSLGSHLLNEALLQAYVDDILAPQRRRELEDYLAADPRQAERIRDFRSQNDELHALFDRYLAAPTPDNIDALQHHLVKTLNRRRRAQSYGWLAAAGLLIVGVVGALAVARGPAPDTSWVLGTMPQAMRGDFGSGDAADRPDFESLGFKAVGSRRVGSDQDVTQFVFESPTGRRIMLYEGVAAPEDRQRVSLTHEGPLSILVWAHESRAYTLVGELDRASMLRLVGAVSGERRADRMRAVVAPQAIR